MGRKTGELYVRIGLTLRTHQRAFRVGALAMGVYTFCQMQARSEERAEDGCFSGLVVQHGCWGTPPKVVARALEQLIEAGYLERVDHDTLCITRYAEWNETLAEIHAARDAARIRMRKSRVRSITVTPNIDRTNAFVPDSDSVSDQDLDRKREPEIQTAPAAPVLSAGTFGMSEHAWREGLTAALGRPVAALPTFERARVEDLLRTHGEGKETAQRLDWLRRFAREYAEHEISSSNGKYGIKPGRAIAWLEAGKPRDHKPDEGARVERQKAAVDREGRDFERRHREYSREAVPPPADLLAAVGTPRRAG